MRKTLERVVTLCATAALLDYDLHGFKSGEAPWKTPPQKIMMQRSSGADHYPYGLYASSASRNLEARALVSVMVHL